MLIKQHANFGISRVERRVERFRDLERDGDAPARQREDDDIRTAGVMSQLGRQLHTSFPAVCKWTMRLIEHD